MISKRLEIAAEYLQGFYCLADCGTDHAYLPILALSKKYIKKAYASDNKESPLKNAEMNIIASGFEDDITLALADGLPYLNPEVDIVSILGMGGRLISDILSEADLADTKRLILSPNSEAEILRKYLESNNWKIIDEVFIKERNKYYQIIIAEKGEMILNCFESEFGPIIIKRKPIEFIEYINKLISKLDLALNNIKNQEEYNKVTKRIKNLEEVIF